MYLVVIRLVSIVTAIISAAGSLANPRHIIEKNQEPVFHIGSFYVIITTCLRKFRRCKTGIIGNAHPPWVITNNTLRSSPFYERRF